MAGQKKKRSELYPGVSPYVRTNFMFFSKDQKENKKEGEVLSSKLIAERWASLTPEEKEPWDKKHEEDKQRYYDAVVDKGYTIKKKKVSGGGTRPVSAFFLFARDNKASYMEVNKVGYQEALKIMGTEWAKMKKEESDVYKQYCDMAIKSN